MTKSDRYMLASNLTIAHCTLQKEKFLPNLSEETANMNILSIFYKFYELIEREEGKNKILR